MGVLAVIGVNGVRLFVGILLLFPLAVHSASTTVAFGSCLRQAKPQPVWAGIAALELDAFIFLGDNVYADTTDPDDMRASYARLAAQPGYQRLLKQCPVFATWDDHDYGEDNAGADYPMRAESEKIFLDFFGVAEDAPVRGYPGVYRVRWIDTPQGRIQIILLDTRYFRSPLKPSELTFSCLRGNIPPNHDPDATILGEQQWQWLAGQLRQPAALRVIASSIQVIPDQHCFEKWANFPLERQRLLDLIRDSGAGVVLISGDRHHAEISRLDGGTQAYPLYEVTASGMNSARAGRSEDNRYRVGRTHYRGDNFGSIRVDWTAAKVWLRIHDVDGAVVHSHGLDLPAEPPGGS